MDVELEIGTERPCSPCLHLCLSCGSRGFCVFADYQTFIDGIFSMHNPSTRKDALEILSLLNTQQIESTHQRTNLDERLTGVENSMQQMKQSMDQLSAKLDRALAAR